MLSAYALALESKNNGFLELVDIGSGDGRIAFCGEVVGLHSNSIEIDESLCSLQENILQNMVVGFSIINEDATKIDYKTIKLVKPVFFIGGLPENGELLAESIIKNILKLPKLEKNSCFALTGTHAERTSAKNQSDFGWGVTTKKFNLKIIDILDLPTYWTMEQSFNTPYIFTNYS
jgi:16S rRNA A1518/A1519 N6-dimethyltransferase RsmA/KsgA/DIM1 with predicted DNA glycosylase/AP lyase activity